MLFLRKNKKALSETVSFIFLTLLIVVVSITSYSILNLVMDDNIKEFDRNNFEIHLKKINYLIDEISTFDGVTKSIYVDFNFGSFGFEGNEMYYQSLVKFNDSEIFCFDDLCYQGINGFEKIFFNMSSYTFSSNFSLVPGSYLLTFTNSKDEAQINVKIK